ncbi:MAG: tetratricopeptide repeat protein [Bryobacterales bacterium]|nr:tetratricopeptide repeat protein [Bryobacterales bacterium]
MTHARFLEWTGIVALSVLIAASGQAQTRGGGGPAGGNTGGSTGSSGTPANVPSVPTVPSNTPSNTPSTLPGRTQQPGQQYPEMMSRPMYVSGKVVTDSGTPPPDFATMELVCGSQVRPQGYTDSKGRFSFELGRSQGVFMDASTSGAPGMGPGMSDTGMGTTSRGDTATMGRTGGYGSMMGGGVNERMLMGCEIRAALPGYRSDVVNLAGRRVMDNPDVGTIILHRLANVEGTIISANSLAAPKDARKEYDKARDSIRKDKWEDAAKHLHKALAAYPEYADAWFELGQYYQKQNNRAEARNAYTKAVGIDGKFIKPYLPLAFLASSEQKWADVAEYSGKAIKLDPISSPQAFFFNAVAEYNLHHLDLAEKSVRRGIEIDTKHRIPKMNHLLGVILADKQDYPGAAAQLKNYLEFAPKANDADQVRQQLAEVEKFASSAVPATK